MGNGMGSGGGSLYMEGGTINNAIFSSGIRLDGYNIEMKDSSGVGGGTLYMDSGNIVGVLNIMSPVNGSLYLYGPNQVQSFFEL